MRKGFALDQFRMKGASDWWLMRSSTYSSNGEVVVVYLPDIDFWLISENFNKLDWNFRKCILHFLTALDSSCDKYRIGIFLMLTDILIAALTLLYYKNFLNLVCRKLPKLCYSEGQKCRNFSYFVIDRNS